MNDEVIRINLHIKNNISPELFDMLKNSKPGPEWTTRLLTLVGSGLNLEKFQIVPVQGNQTRSVVDDSNDVKGTVPKLDSGLASKPASGAIPVIKGIDDFNFDGD